MAEVLVLGLLFAGLSVAMHRWMRHPWRWEVWPLQFWRDPVGCFIEVIAAVGAFVLLIIGEAVLGIR
jgi:hypothetical protein